MSLYSLKFRGKTVSNLEKLGKAAWVTRERERETRVS
jgi:hypothetical protein